jgi:ferredoxin
VHCLVVEDRHEMLADPIEVEEAAAEGVVIHNHVAPKRILGANGHARAIETLGVVQAFDERGRFNPQLAPNSEKIWECDSVIVAIGQSGELDWVQPGDGLAITPRGTLKIDPETLATTATGVYAGGDIAFGPRLIINAVADGQHAARGIHAYLQNVQPRRVRKGFFTPLRKQEYPQLGPLRDYLRWPRRQPPMLPTNRRIGVSQVEIGFDEELAREQGGRCLICSINPIFDGELCIMCNGCVDVCPMDCLKLVSRSEISTPDHVAAWIDRHFDPLQPASAMLLDSTLCIRCGLCAARCPTEAVKMETFRFTEEVIFEKIVE